ncbi:MAG: sodium:calcium antiporter [Candidatus Omnitrophica bacterium]|nr:sodium:calcium antiporter [Candidatus Omnitrophota bacterium]
MEAIHAVWTFPAIILAAMLIAWAAECGQFYISQGLALAVLAWVQTLPEFAVEATIALEAAKDPAKVHLITANFTGSLRLFVGLGWPMVYFVAFFCRGRKFHTRENGFWSIHMDDDQCVAVLSLLPALAYFVWIYLKGTLTLFDGVALTAIYAFYFYLLSKMPPQSAEGIEDLGRIPRALMKLEKKKSILGIFLFFAAGALILWFVAHPFLESMLALALAVGVSQFVFVQWVAPFLSEFPEKLSAFHWARQTKKAPMALANFVSSSINQWTILVATVPFIYSFGLGHPAEIVFDEHQKVEILLTIVQSYLGFLFLASMDFSFPEAAGLFALWIVQFFVPGLREEITWVYAGWALVETARMLKNRRRENAFSVFGKLSRECLFKRV